MDRNYNYRTMEVRHGMTHGTRQSRQSRKPVRSLNKVGRLIRDFFLLFMTTSSIHGFTQVTTKKRHPIEGNEVKGEVECFELSVLFGPQPGVFILIWRGRVLPPDCLQKVEVQPGEEHYKILWFLALSAAVWGSVKVSWSTWKRFQGNPTVVSIERNYHDWNTSFPAIALCPESKYSEKSINNVLQRYPNIKDQSAFAEFFKGLVNGSYLTWNDTLKTPFYDVNPNEFWKIAFDIAPKFAYNVSNSNMENYNVLSMRRFMTDFGICYSYNSLASPYSEKEYWENKNWSSVLNLPLFEGNPLDGDIFAQVMNMNTGYTLFLLDPYEVPDVAMKFYLAGNNSYKTLDITALSIASDVRLNSLSIKQRKCRFPKESDLITSPVYSFYMCRQECRMKLSKKLCGCVAYFYRPTDGYPVCDYDGIQCLIKHGELLHFLSDENENKVPCDCLPLCSETTYVVSIDNTMPWTLGTNLKWGLVKYPKLRYKRDIIFGISDLIVAIGGTAGLFLGCSLLSFAEIFYFFTLRLVIFLCRNQKRKH